MKSHPIDGWLLGCNSGSLALWLHHETRPAGGTKRSASAQVAERSEKSRQHPRDAAVVSYS
jgi:hypothetical protein